MFTRFGQIFWGLLLVILDFRVNRIEILPDFVGYILLAVGCGGLASVSRCFSTAATLSWILTVLSLVPFVVRGGIAAGFGVLNLAVDCAMMWFLLGGVMEFATARQRTDLTERASNRRIAYVVLMSLGTLTGLLAQGSRGAAVPMAIVFVLCVIPLLVLILHLIHRVKHELANDQAA